MWWYKLLGVRDELAGRHSRRPALYGKIEALPVRPSEKEICILVSTDPNTLYIWSTAAIKPIFASNKVKPTVYGDDFPKIKPPKLSFSRNFSKTTITTTDSPNPLCNSQLRRRFGTLTIVIAIAAKLRLLPSLPSIRYARDRRRC
uniref:CAA303721.1 protein n=1 Tax=Oryza sativa TaxID=4530 RepID=Q9ST76_ORYSA|nr:CAA303721.1 protein [Oryza sativa]